MSAHCRARRALAQLRSDQERADDEDEPAADGTHARGADLVPDIVGRNQARRPRPRGRAQQMQQGRWRPEDMASGLIHGWLT